MFEHKPNQKNQEKSSQSLVKKTLSVAIPAALSLLSYVAPVKAQEALLIPSSFQDLTLPEIVEAQAEPATAAELFEKLDHAQQVVDHSKHQKIEEQTKPSSTQIEIQKQLDEIKQDSVLPTNQLRQFETQPSSGISLTNTNTLELNNEHNSNERIAGEVIQTNSKTTSEINENGNYKITTTKDFTSLKAFEETIEITEEKTEKVQDIRLNGAGIFLHKPAGSENFETVFSHKESGINLDGTINKKPDRKPAGQIVPEKLVENLKQEGLADRELYSNFGLNITGKLMQTPTDVLDSSEEKEITTGITFSTGKITKTTELKDKSTVIKTRQNSPVISSSSGDITNVITAIAPQIKTALEENSKDDLSQYLAKQSKPSEKSLQNSDGKTRANSPEKVTANSPQNTPEDLSKFLTKQPKSASTKRMDLQNVVHAVTEKLDKNLTHSIEETTSISSLKNPAILYGWDLSQETTIESFARQKTSYTDPEKFDLIQTFGLETGLDTQVTGFVNGQELGGEVIGGIRFDVFSGEGTLRTKKITELFINNELSVGAKIAFAHGGKINKISGGVRIGINYDEKNAIVSPDIRARLEIGNPNTNISLEGAYSLDSGILQPNEAIISGRHTFYFNQKKSNKLIIRGEKSIDLGENNFDYKEKNLIGADFVIGKSFKLTAEKYFGDGVESLKGEKISVLVRKNWGAIYATLLHLNSLYGAQVGAIIKLDKSSQITVEYRMNQTEFAGQTEHVGTILYKTTF
jgi:hypothetical protein